MIILHIANVGSDRFAGVNVAVPEMIRAQSAFCRVGFLNLTDLRIPDISDQFVYRRGLDLASLPVPFSKPDIVVFHEIYRLPYLPLAHQVKRMGIPYILVPHGGLTVGAQQIKVYKKRPANLLLFGPFIRGAAAIQCLSQRELEQTHFPTPKFIGTNGIALGNAKQRFSEDGMQFSYIGRIDSHIKGLDLMLDALRQERSFLEQNRCRFDLYGPDIGNCVVQLQEMSQKHGTDTILTFHGPVVGAEKEAVLAQTDCYIQTSRSEGMSLGILEALSHGIPCLLTQGTSLRELVESSGAGWGCETDSTAIAAVLRQAVQQRQALMQMSKNARDLVQTHFPLERITEQTIAHYQRILRERNGQPCLSSPD